MGRIFRMLLSMLTKREKSYFFAVQVFLIPQDYPDSKN